MGKLYVVIPASMKKNVEDVINDWYPIVEKMVMGVGWIVMMVLRILLSYYERVCEA